MRLRRCVPHPPRYLSVLLLTALIFGLKAQNIGSPRPNTFVLARNGEAFLYDEESGLEGVPFLSGVYKSFGFSPDLQQFLYLKADRGFPTFALYSYNVKTRTEKRITDAAVHHAAWSPAEPLIAYLSLDQENHFHLSTYDLASGRHSEIATGRFRSDFLEWSPDGAELAYIEAAPLTTRAAEDGQFTRTLHRHSLRQNTDTIIPTVDWAQFSGGEIVVLSGRATLRYRAVPNPNAEEIRRFAVVGGETYAEVLDDSRPVVKRWDARSSSFRTVQRGEIFLRTRGGIVARQFVNGGIKYDYIAASGVHPLGQNPSMNWKIPFAGIASIIQGGQLYVDGSCDGATCFVVSHGNTLGYALDWQQMPENREGNTHVLASGDGTVAVAINNVTCNSASPSCSVGWDDYSATCSDNGGAGNHVVIAHLDGTYSLNAHLKSGSVQVVPGQNVVQGTYLADQGHSGVAGSYNNYLGCGDHLHFSRQVGPGIWEQSVPTDFVETPCLVGCRSPYTSSNVELAPAPSLTQITPSSWTPGATVTVTFTGTNFVYGSTVNAGASGIVAGNVAMLSPTRLIATFTIPSGTTPGAYNITVTTPNGTSNAMTFNVVALASGGSLSGSVTTPSGPQNLTAQGVSDWAHWGLSTDLSFNHKSGVVPQIGNFTVVGSGAPVQYSNDPLGYGWSDGTPTAATAGSTTGLMISGQNNGFSITAPADPTPRTLTVYVGVSGAQGQFRAQLSDGSASDYIDASLNSSGAAPGAYTITYTAASPGQTLLVTFTQLSSSGSITLQGATLSGGSVGPDFAIAVTPPAQSLLLGNSNTYTVNLSALSGFTSAIALSASGLPAGVTASFNPTSVTGSGSSTLTVTAANSVAPGNYPVAVSAASGATTHSTTVDVTVMDFAVTAGPSTRSVIAGGSVTYTVSVPGPTAALATIALTAAGLPAGATASFNPASIAPGGSSIMTVSVASGTAVGSYPVTLTASAGTIVHTTPLTLTITPSGSAGGLVGTKAAPPATVQLTTEGSLDWVHWGLNTAASVDRKAVPLQITDLSVVGGGNLYRYSNNSSGFTWTDGAPTASVTNSTTGIFTMGIGKGFSITAPADTTVRTLRVYVGAFKTQGRIIARLSDGSAPDYIDTSLSNSTPPTTVAVYSFTYSAASSGQTLTVTYVQNTDVPNGNITIQAATLAGSADFSIAATPPAKSVVAGSPASFTASVTALSGFSGAVGLTVGGLPAGVTAAFNPASITGSGSSTLTLTTTTATPPGTYPLTITATSGSLVHTAGVNLTINAPATGGTLGGSMATPTGTAQLTTEGTSDWAHWGLAAATDFDHKAGVAQQISNFSMTAGGTPARYANNSIGFTWTDGTPTVSATSSTTGLFVSGVGNGFRITAPADTSARTLRVYVGAWRTQGKMVAQLSDGSAPDYVDTSLSNSAGVTTLGVYTFTYAAASAGQTLTITYTQNTSTAGNVTLQAATLAIGAPVADFTISATPPSQSASAGNAASYTVTVGAVNGFAGSVALSVSGLPAGVTASFNPATVTGSGASTMTLTSAAAAPTGNYPLIVTGTSGALSHTANATLAVTDFSVSATPGSQSVVAGASAAYTVAVTALNGFAGNVAFGVTGLPAGVSASFNPTTLSGGGSSTMTLGATAGTTAGNYPFTVTATSGNTSHTANATLIVTAPAAGGTLAGSSAAPTGPVQLTTEGTSDWAHWAIATAADFDHKAGVTQQISNFTVVGTGTPGRYANNSVGFTWTDGIPTASATNTTTGLFIAGQGQGFRITAPADTTARTLRIYVGAWRAQARMIAHLSDASAPDYSDGALTNSSGVTTLRVYTLTYSAASAGQTLTVTFTQETPTISGVTGNVTLQAASLAGGSTATADFGVTATPSTQSTVSGGSASYTVNVNALNGFTGTVALTAGGLPSGVTASFNPATVTGSGSATVTLTVASGTAAGTYPVTITATSGALTHTASVSLVVTDFSVSATPASQSTVVGGNAVYTTSVTAQSGFAGNVSLSISGLPAGVTAAFAPSTVTGGTGSSTLTLTVASGTATGTYPATITATSGALTHTAPVTLVVTDFSVSATPATQSVAVGGNTTYNASVTALNGFAGNVALSISGLPAGVTAAFTPSTVTGGSGASTLALTVGSGATAGSYPLTITGASAGVTRIAAVTLAITAAPDFSISATPSSASAAAGGSASYTVNVNALNGFTADVALSLAGAPSGVTAAFSPPSIAGGAGSSTLTLAAAAGTAAGSYTLTITGAGGSLTHTATVTFTVSDFTVAATPQTQTAPVGGSATFSVAITPRSGFNGDVALAISGLPSGVTATFSPTTVPGGSGSSTLTLSVAGTAATGSYPLTITATSGAISHTASITLAVTDFSISITPGGQNATVGGNAVYTVTVTAQNGFSGTVSFGISGLPQGVTAAFAPATVNGSGTSTMTVTVPAGAAVGTYQFSVTASSGTLSRTASATLMVTDFAITATPSSQSATAGGSATYSVSMNAQNGFSGTVALSASGLPAGVTASFNPPTLTGSGSSIVTLTVASATAAGNYSFTIAAASGGVTRTTSAALAVTDFTVSATPSSQSVTAGSNGVYTVNVTAQNGFSGTVGLSASGLPAGVTAAFNPATMTGSGSSSLTVTVPSGTAAGTYPVTITASSGSTTHTTSVTLSVAAAVVVGGGTLTGSPGTPSGTIQLTTEGTADWTHWALNTATDLDRKAGVTAQISNFTVVGAGTPGRYANNAVGFTWTDGTPTATATASTTGLFIAGQGQGFRITVPADTATRTLRVYVGAWRAQGRFVAHLSDNSAADYSDGTLTNSSGITTLRVYTLTYNAATAGQTLTVTFSQENPTVSGVTGNVTLQAATLSGGAQPADFTVAVTPGSQSVAAGTSAVYTATVGGTNGFSSAVSLAAGGLPSGVSAGFNPSTVSGSGSSTMTLTVTAGATAGTYPLTLTATSGSIVHTTNFSLTITPPVGSGVLNGSVATPTGTIQLTTEGTSDWAHWGLNTAADFDHKAAVTQQISNFTSVAGATPARYANNSVGFTWTDGSPTAVATNSTTGVFVSGQGQGFRFTAPADTTSRVLRIYVGAWRTQGRLVAHLSDGSASDFVDTSVVNSSGVTTLGVYTLTYHAASPGQTLTVTYIQNTATAGNVTIQAATVQ